jgi:hypothetical protein
MENRTENKLPPTETPSDMPRQEQSGAGGFLRKNSLQLAGILNLIGDIGFLMRGVDTMKGARVKGEKQAGLYNVIGGGLYTVGGLNLTLFGRVKNDPLKDVTRETALFLKEKSALPEGSALAKIPTTPEKKNFFDRNAAQNTLVPYTLGAGALLVSGVKTYRNDPREWEDMAYGISSVAVKLLSFLIPEKKRGKEEGEPSGFFGKIVAWVREKPLRVFGYGSAITDTFLALKAYKNYRNGTKGFWSVVTAITYILADTMMAISNKDKSNAAGKLTAEEQRKVEAMAAEAIAKQEDPVQRGALVEEVAGFLAKRPEIGGSRESIRKALVTQVEHKGTTQVKSAEAEVAAH